MTEIVMQGVNSSNIDSVGFGQREGTEYGQLRIQFKSGAQWEYDDVSRQVYVDLASAVSIGKFYNQNIRNVYQGRKVE